MTLIRDWRTQWGEGDFPFYIVQLANLGRPPQNPEESDWAEVAECNCAFPESCRTRGRLWPLTSVRSRISIRGTSGRPAIDYALLAMAKTYGIPVESSGPIYELMQVEGEKIRIKFSSLAGGLVAKDGALKQFAIAGSDKKFAWAVARIEGKCVVVSSTKVAEPVAVRYAWAKNPYGCNLYNQADLPASPFRTDDW